MLYTGAILKVFLVLYCLSGAAMEDAVCYNCDPTNGQYACINETAFGLCFAQGVVDESAIQNCRQGYYCVLEGFCASMDSSEPACVPDPTTTTDITTETTEESTSDSSTVTPTETTEESTTTTNLVTDPSTDSSTSQTTDFTTPTASTDSSTEYSTTTESSTLQTTEDSTTSSDIVTDSSTESTESSTLLTTEDSTTSSDIVTDSSTESTTAFTTTTETPSTESSSTTVTESTTSKDSTAINPDEYCSGLKQKGYYRVETDTTCRQYVYCYKLAQDYLGWLYYCNTGYYNSETKSCQSDRPSNC